MLVTKIIKKDKIKIVFVLIFIFLFLISMSKSIGFLAAQSPTKLTYFISLRGTTQIYGMRKIEWKAYGNLILYNYGNGEIRLRLNVGYLSPSLPELFNTIRPELEGLLFNLREAIESGLREEGSSFSGITVPYYSNDLKSMMKCLANVKVNYYKDQEGVTLFMPSKNRLPVYIIFNGNIEGKAVLSSAQGFICGLPLVSKNTKKMLFYLTFGISIIAIISFVIFRSRWKSFYWREV